MRLENGYFIWTRGPASLLQLSPHFKAVEFECFCSSPKCTEQRINAQLVERLEAMRMTLGKRITITDGFRCAGAQRELRDRGFPTANGVSTHELGDAADIKASQITPLLELASKRFKAIGIARTWLHVDMRDDKKRRWFYK